MPRRSQTSLAVLGALSTGPMTGYELRSAITETLGHFWRESFGQIYPTLAALEAEGAVRRERPGHTSGSTFALTDDGLALLRELLAVPPEPQAPRNALLLRLFFGTHLLPGGAERLLEAAAARARESLEQYAAVRAEETDAPEHPVVADEPGRLHRDLTLDFGERVARAQLDWAVSSLARLREAGAG